MLSTSTAQSPSPVSASTTVRTALYASVGSAITHYEVDVDRCTLARKDTIGAPEMVHYAWPHPGGSHLYVASSDGGPTVTGRNHHLTAFRIDPTSGALRQDGWSAPLPSRPIHVTVDVPGRHVLTAYHYPAGVTVHRLNVDGTLAEQVPQQGRLDAGTYPHQIRVAPSNRIAIVVARGNDPEPDKPEDPGALKILDFRDGLLVNRASVAPGGGFGFGPRHIDFAPSGRWLYAALERQNALHVYALEGDSVGSQPLFVEQTLADPGTTARQLVGTVHVHPSGHYVYVANRGTGTVEFDGKPVFSGGENDIVVFSIDQSTGKPALIQRMGTRGISARTFSLDPDGRMLVAANSTPLDARSGAGIHTIPASLSTYRIGSDGTLEFVTKYDLEVEGRKLFWMTMTRLA